MPRASHPLVTARRTVGALLLTATLALAGCGGGVYVGLGGNNDNPPNVSLAVSPTSAFAGDTINLAAAASDDFRVDKVEFWYSDGNGNVLRLSTDFAAPYTSSDTMQVTRSGSTFYMARAFDDVGQATDTPWHEVRLR
jgi:hypothetical protein